MRRPARFDADREDGRLRWLVLPIIAVSVGLIGIAIVAASTDRSTDSVIAMAVIGAVSLVAMLLTWLEARRSGRRLRATITELSTTQAAVSQLLDDLPDAVIGLDGHGRIMSANSKAAALTGRRIPETTRGGTMAADDYRNESQDVGYGTEAAV